MITRKTVIASLIGPTLCRTRRWTTVAPLPLVLFCSVFPAASQETGSPANVSAPAVRLESKRIDDALTRMVADGRAAGVAVLVWKDGREAHFSNAGYADREAQRPMTRDTIAQIYSMTKPITGVALMQLWEQGKFGLDDPLSRYLPEFTSMQVYAGKNAAGAPIYRAARVQSSCAISCGILPASPTDRALHPPMLLT